MTQPMARRAIQVISTIVQPNVAPAVHSKNTRLVIVP